MALRHLNCRNVFSILKRPPVTSAAVHRLLQPSHKMMLSASWRRRPQHTSINHLRYNQFSPPCYVQYTYNSGRQSQIRKSKLEKHLNRLKVMQQYIAKIAEAEDELKKSRSIAVELQNKDDCDKVLQSQREKQLHRLKELHEYTVAIGVADDVWKERTKTETAEMHSIGEACRCKASKEG